MSKKLKAAQSRSAHSAVHGDASPLVETIRGLLFRGTWDGLAEKAGVSPTTVQAFASGKTRHPRLETFIGLADAVGISVTMRIREGSVSHIVRLNDLSRSVKKK